MNRRELLTTFGVFCCMPLSFLKEKKNEVCGSLKYIFDKNKKLKGILSTEPCLEINEICENMQIVCEQLKLGPRAKLINCEIWINGRWTCVFGDEPHASIYGCGIIKHCNIITQRTKECFFMSKKPIEQQYQHLTVYGCYINGPRLR